MKRSTAGGNLGSRKRKAELGVFLYKVHYLLCSKGGFSIKDNLRNSILRFDVKCFFRSLKCFIYKF